MLFYATLTLQEISPFINGNIIVHSFLGFINPKGNSMNQFQ
jgi:hypothetical protein